MASVTPEDEQLAGRALIAVLQVYAEEARNRDRDAFDSHYRPLFRILSHHGAFKLTDLVRLARRVYAATPRSDGTVR